MAEQDEPRKAEDPAAPPASEDDTEGHSLGYEFARLHAKEMARDADAWASQEAIRKQVKSRSLLDRLRGR
jgi:hypothetical protein